MRKDVTHFYEKPIPEVFYAYHKFIVEKMHANPRVEPFHTISSAVGMGAMTLHFIPYQNGTAIDIRYSLALVNGSVVEEIDYSITKEIVNFLGVAAMNIELPIEIFLDPNNQVVAQSNIPNPAPQPAPQAPVQNEFRFCPKCGAKHHIDANFCPACGNKLK